MTDLRDAIRSLARTPAFTAAAILTLALGIGSNTAMFSLLNAMLFKPLPVRDPHRLVMLTEGDEASTAWRLRVWVEVRDRQILDGSFAWFWNRFNTAQAGEKQFVDGIEGTGAMFDALGLRPLLGRLLTTADDRPGGGPDGLVAVISYRFWKQRYGGAPDVLGRSITIERQPFTIVGVTPPEFVGLNIGLPFDVAIPLKIGPQVQPDAAFREPYVHIMGRLKPEQTFDALTAVLRALQPEIREATNPYSNSPYKEEYLQAPFTARPAAGGVSVLRRRYEEPLKILLTVVGLVLLIGCGNIAALLVARTIGRRHELAVRVALGGSRTRLARELLVESLLLSILGAAIGVLFAQWGTRLIVSQLSTQAYAVFLDLTPDWRVLGFTALAGMTTAVLFGAGPAVRAAHADPMAALRQRGAIAEPPFGAGNIVIVAQVALSLILVVTTGLLLRTFLVLANSDVGFAPERVLAVTVDVENSSVSRDRRTVLYEQLNDAVTSAGGVESAALSLAMPGGNYASTPWFDLADGTALPQGPNGVYGNRITPGWFHTLGTRVLEGREFGNGDRIGAPGVAIVNEAFVQRFLKGQRAVGQTIFQRTQPDGSGQPLEIVGVVENAMYRFLKETPPPTVYTSLAQMSDPIPASLNLSVRGADVSDPRLSRNIVEAIGNVDRDISVMFRTLSDQINAQYAQERLVAGVATAFGVIALLLAALGLYGVTAYNVTRRRLEIGVRVALGADRAGIFRLVFGRLARVVGAGFALGLVGSLFAAQVIKSMLYGVEPDDAATFASAATVLLAVAVAAAWPPARRAACVDPAQALRAE
jgi:predicted permease